MQEENTTNIVTQMTLYDINKQIMVDMKPVSNHQLVKDFNSIGFWFSKFKDAKYFMLLCRERSDYTIFHLNGFNYALAVEELRGVLESRGTLMGINYVHGEDTYECWVRIDDEVFMFLLFEATGFVVEV